MEYLFVLFVLVVCFVFAEALEITTSIQLPTYNTYSYQSCSSLNKDYFDSTLLNCQSCPTNQTANSLSVDGSGNSDSCMCDLGYKQTTNSCANVNFFESFFVYLCIFFIYSYFSIC